MDCFIFNSVCVQKKPSGFVMESGWRWENDISLNTYDTKWRMAKEFVWHINIKVKKEVPYFISADWKHN